MNTRNFSSDNVKRLTMIAMLAAVVVVLQAVGSVIKIGPFPINLALTPIIIGAALYGWKAGAILGTVLGVYIFCAGLWIDGSMVAMVQYNFFAAFVLCLGKTAAAGALAGLVFRLIEKKNAFVATLTASIVTPITNTAIYALGMMSIFNGFLGEIAAENGSTNPISFLFLAVIGVNFIIEFILNVSLATIITRIIDYYNRRMKGKNNAARA